MDQSLGVNQSLGARCSSLFDIVKRSGGHGSSICAFASEPNRENEGKSAKKVRLIIFRRIDYAIRVSAQKREDGKREISPPPPQKVSQ